MSVSDAPEGIRTPDLLVRSQLLYPAELPAHLTFSVNSDIIAHPAGKVKPFFHKICPHPTFDSKCGVLEHFKGKHVQNHNPQTVQLFAIIGVFSAIPDLQRT